MHSKTVIVISVIALLLGANMAGCGQKGDLYLPEERPESERNQAHGLF